MVTFIRTPDQRLRVFVSSAKHGLDAERRAARAAIARMQLAPVMLELGAHPHPPRSLYRSYIEQSDVFLGIYAFSDDGAEPVETVRGLEEEYDLAPAGIPKLIYIKASDASDGRLTHLTARIGDDDAAEYMTFTSAAELEDQIASDLATLLAERFAQSRDRTSERPGVPASVVSRLPLTSTPIIGRDREIVEVRALLEPGGSRMVSLIGPGGIGKSRLAIEVAGANEALFPDGRYFVPLEGVLEADLLLPTIAFTLGVRDNGEAALEERILSALANRRVLVVLDNFEQIVDAAPTLVRLYTSAVSARFLVTSRTVLRIRGEQVYEVPPLEVSGGAETLERVLQSSACVLFADRAQAVRPDFTLTEENARDVADICSRLEGLPLAIELAAAKVRMLTPHGIAERLGHSLQILTTGGRDLPERQHTMRATIDWSVSLLSPTPRDLLADLGVFATRFTLDAVEAIGVGRSWGNATMEGIAALVDGSLVKQTDVDGRAVFSLLTVVREYALGQLEERGDAETMQAAHADYYSAMVRRIAPGLRGGAQVEAIAQLGFQLSNLRAAIRHLMYTDRLDDAGDFAWNLLIYWWIMGFLAEVRVWMLELLAKEGPITPHTRAVAWFLTLWGQMWQNPTPEVVAGLGECVRLFANSGDEDAAAMAIAARATARAQLPDPDLDTAEEELREARTRLKDLGNGWAEAISEVSLGRMSWLRGALDEAMAHFDRATEIAKAGGDLFTKSVASNQAGRLLLLREESDAAEQVFRGTMLDSIRVHHDGGVAYSLEGFAGVAAQRGDARRAGTLAAVARTIRHRIGMFDVDAFTVHTAFVERLRKTEPDAVAAGERRGVELSLAEAVALALPKPDRELADTVLAHW